MDSSFSMDKARIHCQTREPKDITFVALVSAPEGVETFQKAHPEIELYVASLDEKLDKNAYILPGLGDAGDRVFGTK